ncbi:MAG: hypothetical protein FDZ70_02540 [Actinobacteria bacterium]|nr:MAG: hypothetical protein FDZ70_02540 [Actinomycetota bacterium]
MAPREPQRDALETIFSFFLGLMVLAFTGVGVNTALPSARFDGSTISIALVASATLSMAVSLIRSHQLRIVSNGLLLGGVFTMLYGTGWSIFGENDWTRFLVIAFALVVTIALGYAKFARSREATASGPAPATSGPTHDETALGSLAARVARLEALTSAAAAGFAGENPSREGR